MFTNYPAITGFDLLKAKVTLEIEMDETIW